MSGNCCCMNCLHCEILSDVAAAFALEWIFPDDYGCAAGNDEIFGRPAAGGCEDYDPRE